MTRVFLIRLGGWNIASAPNCPNMVFKRSSMLGIVRVSKEFKGYQRRL